MFWLRNKKLDFWYTLLTNGLCKVNFLTNLNTFLSLLSNKMLVIKAGIHKILVRIANREDPDETAP